MREDEDNEALAEATARAWGGILEEIDATETWLLDPESKVTRVAVADRLRSLGGVVLREMLSAVEDSNAVLREVCDDVRDECEEVLGSENDRIGLRERYAVALRILEDARVDESDIMNVARHADPVDLLRREREERRRGVSS